MKDRYSSCEDLDNAVDTFPVSVSVDGTWQKKDMDIHRYLVRSIANHLSTIVSSDSTYPNFMKQVVNLHDQKYFHPLAVLSWIQSTMTFRSTYANFLAFITVR